MSATLTCEPGDIWTLRIEGLLTKKELDSIRGQVELPANAEKINVLILFNDFEGWKPDDDWGDMSFFHEHGDHIAKMALCGDPKWQAEALMFLGAGIRSTEIRFFPLEQEADAWVWLME